MANAFEFGIGITASDAGASEAIGKIITHATDEFGKLKNSLYDLNIADAFDVGTLDLGGAVDASVFGKMVSSLEDISTTVRMVSEDTGRLAGAFGRLDDPFSAAAGSADRLGSEICGVVVCAENAEDAIRRLGKTTEQTGKGLSEVPKPTKTFGEHLTNVKNAAQLLSGTQSELRHNTMRLYGSMGDTAQQSDLAASGILRLANGNQVAWEQVLQLRAELAKSAVDMDLSTKAGQKTADTMVQLQETFSLTEGQIADLAGSMKVTGGSLTDLTGITAHFQKTFRVPALMNQLPGIMDAVVDAQSSFGTLVGKSSSQIGQDITRMSAVYSRALGINAAQAAEKAKATFRTFTAEIESFEDVFLGLADDFTPMQKAMFETGMGLEDVEFLMRKAQTAPEEFADRVKRIRDQMDPQMGERFYRQMIRYGGEGVKQLLAYEDAQKNANEAAAKGAKQKPPPDPSVIFEKTATAMRQNAVDMQKMQNALLGVASELKNLAGDEATKKYLELQNAGFKGINDTLISGYEILRRNEAAFQTFSTSLAVITGTADTLNKVLGAVNYAIDAGTKLWLGGVSALALLGGGLDKAGKAFSWIRNLKLAEVTTKFKDLWGWFAKLGGGEAGALKGLRGIGGAIGRLAVPITAVISVANGLSGAWQRFQDGEGIIKSVLGGVWDAVDTFFMGMPGLFAEGFMGAWASADASTSVSDYFFLALEGTIAGLQKIGNAILGFFGSTFEALGGDVEVFKASLGYIWKVVAAEFQNFFIDPIRDKFADTMGTMKIQMGALYDVFHGNFDGIKIVFLRMARYLVETFTDTIIGNFVSGAKSLAEALGIDSVAKKLAGLEETINAPTAALTEMIEEAEKAGKASGSLAATAASEFEKERDARAKAREERQKDLDIAREHLATSVALSEQKKRQAELEAKRKPKEQQEAIFKAFATAGVDADRATSLAAKGGGEDFVKGVMHTAEGMDAQQGKLFLKQIMDNVDKNTQSLIIDAIESGKHAIPAATPTTVSDAAQPSMAGAMAAAASAAGGGAGGDGYPINFNPNMNFAFNVAPGVNRAIAALVEQINVDLVSGGAKGVGMGTV